MGAKEDLIDKLENGENNVAEKADLDVSQTEESLQIGEGKQAHRGELVCKEDILKVVEMDKVGLEKYADSRLGKKLDLSKRLKMLRMEVVVLIKNKLSLPTDTDTSDVTSKEVGETANPEFVFNPKNRRIFDWTELLEKRTDLIACYVVDEEGKRL